MEFVPHVGVFGIAKPGPKVHVKWQDASNSRVNKPFASCHILSQMYFKVYNQIPKPSFETYYPRVFTVRQHERLTLRNIEYYLPFDTISKHI